MRYDHKSGISFRKMEERDLPILLELKRESWWGTHNSPILNMKDQKDWYDNLPSTDLYMIAYKNETPKSNKPLKGGVNHIKETVLGVGTFTNIDPIARTMYIGGSALKEHRDHGRNGWACGTDFAFEILNAHRLNAEVVETQFAVLKIDLDHLGFTYEGRRRKSVYKSGQYYDSIHLGLLREEWLARQETPSPCNTNFDLDTAMRCRELSAKRCPPLAQD